MRLSSLSRKLKLKPSELELFYENKGIELLASSNSKLSDEQVKIALEYYDFQEEEEEIVVANSDHLAQSSDQGHIDAQDLEIKSKAEDTVALDVEGAKIEDVEIIEVKEKVNPPSDDELSREEEIVKTPDADDLIKNIEVIKAPVIKLKGLTVKGKIELTPEKVKEKSSIAAKKISTNSHNSKTKKKFSNSFNPLDEARKKAAKKERELRKKRADQLKKEKRARYLKEHPPHKEAGKKKLNKKTKKKSTVYMSAPTPTNIPNQSAVIPQKKSNLFQRIWQWLNTY
ncbi:MAG: hypothetical protein CBB92_11485 [Flammeovirgaceae bacterium TMED32]|nr:MAG: hypothetical protein CBB92_11485 [Flammeovirgaceae bacterium TMED32]